MRALHAHFCSAFHPANNPTIGELLLENSVPHVFPNDADRRHIRQFLRSQRRALTPAAQQHAAARVAHHLCLNASFRAARRIAFYIANDGELDPAALAKRAIAMGKECYLPVLDSRSPLLHFALWRPGDKLQRNRFGIPEPLPRAPRLEGQDLDMVCLPLVGFDDCGNRLGMGGGFYDRTFEYRLSFPTRKPFLVGMAHECQRVASLPAQPWDVPLDMIATDEGCYACAGKR